jgi:hypothetical protein
MRIDFTAGKEVHAALSRIGRTEDVAFAPGGGLLAVAGLAKNRLLLLRHRPGMDAGPMTVELSDFVEIESEALRYPHGLAWLDARTLIAASRGGEVAVFEFPETLTFGRRIDVRPLLRLGPGEHVKTPGSVSALPVGADLVELLVCNNYVDQVSRHLLDRRGGLALIASEILLDRGLGVPDGVAHSPSGRWIAVSNHDHHCVFVYRNDGRLNPESPPDGRLEGFRFPHGLRFAGETRLLVADAGAPFVHLFDSDGGDWSGDRRPSRSLRAVDDAVFVRGRYDPQEGGPKGLDISADGRVLVATCEEQPLAFFDLRALLGPAAASSLVQPIEDEAERARNTLLRYVASTQSSLRTATEAVRLAGEREMRNVVTSRSWQMTAPLRRLSAAAERARRWSWRGRH